MNWFRILINDELCYYWSFICVVLLDVVLENCKLSGFEVYTA
jgi:hypothetical protein